MFNRFGVFECEVFPFLITFHNINDHNCSDDKAQIIYE